jgi:hypothetical protein
MTEARRSYAVDRIEGDRAILIGDHDARSVEVPVTSLSNRLREGMVLTVPLDARGRPDWGRVEREEGEERRRLAEGKARIERLKRRDPGGDIGV